MNKRYIKRYAPYLSHEFEMLIFGDDGGLPLVLFPNRPAMIGITGATRCHITCRRSKLQDR
jgi:hypothetical protein